MRMTAYLVVLVGCVGLMGCESSATCDEVGGHVVEVMKASLGLPKGADWKNNVKQEVDLCRRKNYSEAQRTCIVKAKSATGIDRCLGQ